MSTETVGRCGHSAPSIVTSGYGPVCALPSGHPGWHKSDSGTEWGERVSPNLNQFADEVHANAVRHGFWPKDGLTKVRNIGEALMLITTEAAEAMEEYRAGWPYNEIRYREEDGKPEGFGIELADIIIRTLDLAAGMNVDIDEAIEIKHRFNLTRPHKHGKAC